jgi:hypothetical protein
VSHPLRNSGAGSPDPVLITDAARSYEEDLAARKRRYGLMMGMRVPCMVLAAVFYQTPWLAVGLLVLSIPLPWMAVLIANDRRPIKREKVSRYGGADGDRPALEARPHPVIDAPGPERPATTPVFDGQLFDGQVFDGEVRGGRGFTNGSGSGGRRAG